jgi:hypothetical protein
MAWQDRFRALGDELTSRKITTDEYRTRVEEVLADADRDTVAPKRVHIPASAAWESPSGEMTQIVGTRDETAPVSNELAGES